MENYDLWLFLDLEKFEQGESVRVIQKACKETSEFRGRHEKRLYFEFNNKLDKMNFIYSIFKTLSTLGYLYEYRTELDANTPEIKKDEKAKIKSSSSFLGRKSSGKKSLQKPAKRNQKIGRR